MEGPSLVIACEELDRFKKKKNLKAKGLAKLPFAQLKNSSLSKVESWGKHLLLTFPKITLRIHFLMFGSYRINNPRPNRDAKLQLSYGTDEIYFYSCAIKELDLGWRETYDWSADLMGAKWSAPKALARLQKKSKSQVGDLLLDQAIFSGLGNIMKNEILCNLKLHPETRLEKLSLSEQKALVRESEKYAWQFYEWKKKNVLKKNWRIMRKKTCPNCAGPVKKRLTGVLQRFSHYCPRCQKKRV